MHFISIFWIILVDFQPIYTYESKLISSIQQTQLDHVGFFVFFF